MENKKNNIVAMSFPGILKQSQQSINDSIKVDKKEVIISETRKSEEESKSLGLKFQSLCVAKSVSQ